MNKIFNLFLILAIAGCSVTKSTKSMHPYSGDSIGCGNFIVYKLTEDNKEYVSIVVDVAAIELASTQAYAIGKADVVKVTRKKYDGEINASLCNDVMARKPKELLEEVATSGIVEVSVSEGELVKANNNEPYKVILVLKNVVFETVSIDYLRLENINVGWLPG